MSSASESAAAAVNAMSASQQSVPEGNICHPTVEITELDLENSIQYVIDGLPDHFKRISNLEAFLEQCVEIHAHHFKIGRLLPRGGVLVRLHKDYAGTRDSIQLPEGLVAKRVRNPAEDAKKSVIVYRVPLWFELENFEDLFGESLASYRRFTKKGTSQETETVELKFYNAADAADCIASERIRLGGHSFRISPKIVAPLRICRVCKTINPKHRPGSCVEIRCGKCSGNHATKDHPQSDETLKCPVCGEAHSFNGCPQRKSASKKALKGAQKSYKQALLSQTQRQKSREVPPPEQLERLLTTPEYAGVLERIFANFLNYLVQSEFIGKQQTPQIMDFWKSARENPAREHQEDQETSDDMDVDPRQSHLTRRRSEEAQGRAQKRSKSTFSKAQAVPCPKGCGYIGGKVGPMSQHEAVCNGKPWNDQKREKAQASRSRMQESQEKTKAPASLKSFFVGNSKNKTKPASSSSDQ